MGVIYSTSLPTWLRGPSSASVPLLNKQQESPHYLDDFDDPAPLVHRSRMRSDRALAPDLGTFIQELSTSAKNAEPEKNHVKSKEFAPTQTRGGEALYPRDEPGEEMSELARIWHIYIDEATKADSSLTEGCSRGIDILLVFTGLFSAVLTTFIIQSYQLMIPDVGETTNDLLAQLIAIQASATGIQPAAQPVDTSPSLVKMHWVNGLWFAALSCSLSTALISMLSKQWLQAYVPNVSGSPRHRARQRQSRYMQLEAWHVLALINALPLLLHVALLLFFAGLIVLLWSVDLAITFATWVIVVSAYAFYFASIWLPLIYPDCPYQHPISEHLRTWLFSEAPVPGRPIAPDRYQDIESQDMLPNRRNSTQASAVIIPTDKLDAAALAWLFTRSTDNYIISAALQAIAGLPRDFTALQILRDAGAVYLVEEGFQACFDKDTTMDLRWHLTDIDGAWSYCRAWMNLTRGTSEQWPLELLEPLWKLQDLKSHPDAAATACCAVALSSFDSYLSQWDLLAYLARYVAGDFQLTHSTICWLLDSAIEGLVQWEMPIAVIEKTVVMAVPVLLRLLHLTEDLPTSNIRSATALALYAFACGPADLYLYQSEERRRANYCEVTLMALSTVAKNPARFGIKDSKPLLNITAQELARLASPVVAQSQRFTPTLKDAARSSLFNLFIEGMVGVGIVPDVVLADILHLFNQMKVAPALQPLFVRTLVDTLWISSHPKVTSWSVRLLGPLLSKCPVSVIQSFTESNGINAVLRAAKAGDIDNGRLQVDGWRTLCTFVNSSTALYSQQPSAPSTPIVNQFDSIFQSDFFETLCSVVTSRRWWLFEVTGHWIPALVNLCRLRPHNPVWRTVIKVVRDAGRESKDHDGVSEILYQLNAILRSSHGVEGDDDNPFGDRDTTNVTMMEQRLAVKSTSPTPQEPHVPHVSDNASTWFES